MQINPYTLKSLKGKNDPSVRNLTLKSKVENDAIDIEPV